MTWAQVVVRGSQQPGINYTLHMRSQAVRKREQDARRQFDAYKMTAYVKGDTAWVVGEWQGEGGHNVHVAEKCEFAVRKGLPRRKFSGDCVPREIALVKIETEGGNIDTSGVADHVEAREWRWAACTLRTTLAGAPT